MKQNPMTVGVRACHQIQRIQYGTDRKRSAGRLGFLWKI